MLRELNTKKAITLLAVLIVFIFSFQNCAETEVVESGGGMLVQEKLFDEMDTMTVFIQPESQLYKEGEKPDEVQSLVNDGMVTIDLKGTEIISAEMLLELNDRLEQANICKKINLEKLKTDVICHMMYLYPDFVLGSGTGEAVMSFHSDEEIGPCMQHEYAICPEDRLEFQEFLERLKINIKNRRSQ